MAPASQAFGLLLVAGSIVALLWYARMDPPTQSRWRTWLRKTWYLVALLCAVLAWAGVLLPWEVSVVAYAALFAGTVAVCGASLWWEMRRVKAALPVEWAMTDAGEPPDEQLQGAITAGVGRALSMAALPVLAMWLTVLAL